MCLPLPVHRVTLSATHHGTGATFNYYIGICSYPNADLMPDPDCMVVQAEYIEKNKTTGAIRCLGRKSRAQLTDTLSKCVCMCYNVLYCLTVSELYFQECRIRYERNACED